MADFEERIIKDLTYFYESVIVEDRYNYYRLERIREEVKKEGFKVEEFWQGEEGKFKEVIRRVEEEIGGGSEELNGQGEKLTLYIVHFLLTSITDTYKVEEGKIRVIRLGSEYLRNIDMKVIKDLSERELLLVEKELDKRPNLPRVLTGVLSTSIVNKALEAEGGEEGRKRREERKEFLEIISKITSYIEGIKASGESYNYKTFIKVGKSLGEAGYKALLLSSYKDCEAEEKDGFLNRYYQTLESVNGEFQKFIQKEYKALFSLSYTLAPYTIDKVMDYIDYKRREDGRKVAIFLFDCMNAWQWQVLKEKLVKESLLVCDSMLYTLIPSITSKGRQAFFKGHATGLTNSNSGEERDFRTFWKKRGRSKEEVLYKKCLNMNEKDAFSKIEVDKSVAIASYIIDIYDKLTHNKATGEKIVFTNSCEWIEESGVVKFIKRLVNANYTLYILPDHGNVTLKKEEEEGKRVRIKFDKSKAEEIGERYITFRSEEEASTYIEEARAFIGNNSFLFREGRSVVFTNHSSFSADSGKGLSHGGSFISEVLIPFGIVKGKG